MNTGNGFSRTSARRHTAWALMFLVVLPLWSQPQPTGPIRGFKVTEGPGRPVVMGDEAWMLPSNRYQVKGLRVEVPPETGQSGWTVIAKECFYDGATKVVSSASTIELRSVDRRFFVSGRGFEWREADNSVTLSNEVHTVMSGAIKLMGSARKATNTLSVVPATTNAPVSTNDTIEVFSDRFHLNSKAGMARYEGNVRVRDPRTRLSSQRLTLEINPANNELKRVVADDQVDMVFTDLRGESQARGDRASYETVGTNDAVELDSNVTWSNGERQGGGDRLRVDMSRDTLSMTSNAWVRLPRSMVGVPGNRGATTGPPAFLEIRSASYDYAAGQVDFRGGVVAREPGLEATSQTLRVLLARTNELQQLIADGSVRVRQELSPKTNLWRVFEADRVTADFASTNRQPTRLAAEGGVLVTQGSDRIRGNRATATADELEMIGAVSWQARGRSGGGGRLKADLKREEYHLMEHAWMKLPHEGMIQLGNAAAKVLPKAKPGPKAPAIVEVQADSDQYYFRPGEVVFEGNVVVSGGAARITCSRLAVKLATEQEKVERLEATGGVVIVQESSTVTGETLVYDVERQEIRLQGEARIRTRSQRMTVTATGTSLTWNLATNQLSGKDYRITADPIPAETAPKPKP